MAHTEIVAHGGVGGDACPSCGRPLDSHNRHVRFRLPDPALDVPESERAAKTWGNDVLLQIEGLGAFVRVLLPISLRDGFAVTVGVWLGVHPDELRHAWDIWLEPEYAGLRLDGRLANRVPPWGDQVFAKPASAVVRDPHQVPYVSASEDPLVQRLLHDTWPHEEILAAMDDFPGVSDRNPAMVEPFGLRDPPENAQECSSFCGHTAA